MNDKEKSVDTQFEEIKQKFEQMTEQQSIILKNLQKQEDIFRSVNSPMQQLCESLGAVYSGQQDFTEYNNVVAVVDALIKAHPVCTTTILRAASTNLSLTFVAGKE